MNTLSNEAITLIKKTIADHDLNQGIEGDDMLVVLDALTKIEDDVRARYTGAWVSEFIEGPPAGYKSPDIEILQAKYRLGGEELADCLIEEGFTV